MLFDVALLVSFWYSLATFDEIKDPIFRLVDLNFDKTTAMISLAAVLFASKMIKPFPQFWRNPANILWIPGYVLFGYYHSFIKLKALLTVYVVAWGTRPGVK